MLRFLSLLLLLLSGLASTQEHPHGHQHHHDFSDVKKWIEMFEAPDRAEWQKPDLVVEKLGLKPGDHVADIGAASGYFTRRLASQVRPGGFALAVDVEPGFFDYIRHRAHREDQRNLFCVRADDDDPHLPEASFDLIFICDTLHHISNRLAYYALLRKTLRGPGSRIVVVDFFKDREIPVGPSKAMRLDRQALKAEFEEAGFSVELDTETLPYQYILTARLL